MWTKWQLIICTAFVAVTVWIKPQTFLKLETGDEAGSRPEEDIL